MTAYKPFSSLVNGALVHNKFTKAAFNSLSKKIPQLDSPVTCITKASEFEDQITVVSRSNNLFFQTIHDYVLPLADNGCLSPTINTETRQREAGTHMKGS